MEEIINEILDSIGKLNYKSTSEDITHIENLIGKLPENRKIEMRSTLDLKLDSIIKTQNEKPEVELEKWDEKQEKVNDTKTIDNIIMEINKANSVKTINNLCAIIDKVEDTEIRSQLYDLAVKKSVKLKKRNKLRVFITAAGIMVCLSGLYKLTKKNEVYDNDGNYTIENTKNNDKDTTNSDTNSSNGNEIQYNYDNMLYEYGTYKSDINDTVYGESYGDINKNFIFYNNSDKDKLDELNKYIDEHNLKRLKISLKYESKRFNDAAEFFDLCQWNNDGAALELISKANNVTELYLYMAEELDAHRGYYDRDDEFYSIDPSAKNTYGMWYWLVENNITEFDDIYFNYAMQRKEIRNNIEEYNRDGGKMSYEDYINNHYYDINNKMPNTISKNLYLASGEAVATIFNEFYKECGIGDYYYILLSRDDAKEIIKQDQIDTENDIYVPWKDKESSKVYKFKKY